MSQYAITVRSVEEDGKLYPQLFLDDTLYELDAWKILMLFYIYIFFVIYKNEWDHWFNLLSRKQRFDTK